MTQKRPLLACLFLLLQSPLACIVPSHQALATCSFYDCFPQLSVVPRFLLLAPALPKSINHWLPQLPAWPLNGKSRAPAGLCVCCLLRWESDKLSRLSAELRQQLSCILHLKQTGFSKYLVLSFISLRYWPVIILLLLCVSPFPQLLT